MDLLKNNICGLEVYKNALSAKECQTIIHAFENDDRKEKGKVGTNRIDASVKQSTDLQCNFKMQEFSLYNEIIQSALDECIDHFADKYAILNSISMWDVSNGYNIQKYIEGEGYYTLHCEHERVVPLRIMAWMIYLNDAECGTEFPYLNTTLKATEGTLAIWSAAWTHAHKGVTPNKGNKYIATGWYEMLVY